jgi:membrane protein
VGRLAAGLEPSREATGTLVAAARSFFGHHLNDWGAALTFYAAISLIPALVIIVAGVGLVGDAATDALRDNLHDLDPGPGRAIALNVVEEVDSGTFSAGLALLIGIVGALWSASSYVGGFMRATGVIYDQETRWPFWRMRPLQIAVTGGVIVGVAATALAIVITGPLAEEVAGLVGLEDEVAQAWDLIKWPGIVAFVLMMFAVLNWAAPYTAQHRFRWITWGGAVATAAWVLGSAGYAFYIENFANYNEVYGSLGAVVGFLIWLWLSNLAMLFGVELNAELDRRTRSVP